MRRYPREALIREIAFLAYHFHWSKREIMAMPHRERHSWVREVSQINRELNDARQAN